MPMISCPKCGRPVSGRARACGYCGESLVGKYFSGEKVGEHPHDQPISSGAAAATTIGVFGCIALIAALVLHLLALMGYGTGQPLELTIGWLLRIAPLTILPTILLVQLLMTGGRRKSLRMDAFWLFLSTCGLALVVQAYLDGRADAFYGVLALPYLLAVGCGMIVLSTVLSLLVFQR